MDNNNMDTLFRGLGADTMGMYSNMPGTSTAGKQQEGENAGETVYRHIYALSQGGEYPVLLSVPRLASQLGMAGITVTRALKALTGTGRMHRHRTPYGYAYSIHKDTDVKTGTVQKIVLL